MSVPRDQVFHATKAHVRQTLATALRTWLPEESWSKLRKLVENRRIMVNGNLCRDSGRVLQVGDVVKVLVQPLAAPPDERSVRIPFLDAYVVVVEKPAGVTSTRHHEEEHFSRQRKQLQPTLDEMVPRVLAQRQSTARLRENERRAMERKRPTPKNPRLGSPVEPRMPKVFPVHRLDRETSGLIVFARTPAVEKSLMEQFRAHTTHRRYLAIAAGHVVAQKIETQLVRDRGDGKRGSTQAPNTGKRAVTHITPIEYVGEYTLLECRLETGRTHQIRIHLSEIGHPLCGEKMYRGAAACENIPDRSGAQRVALHAAELGFVHPNSGEFVKFQSPLPSDLAALLERLRQTAKTE